MKKIFKLNNIVLFAMLLFLFSCEQEDNTGYSTLKPGTPNVTVTVSSTTISLLEQDSVFSFDIALSAAQVSDVVIYVTSAGSGDNPASAGDDFSIETPKITIPASQLTGVAKIKVLADELTEVAESFTITIGDERTTNATLTPVTITFTITNSIADVLECDMSWATDIADEDATDVVDLMMYVYDTAADTIVTIADGAAFEHYEGWNTLADGTYTIAAGIYATGNYGVYANIDIELVFNQYGIINDETILLEKVMTNKFTCDLYRTNLATVTKTGTTYTFAEAVSQVSPDVEVWYGIDVDDTSGFHNYPSQVVSYEACANSQAVFEDLWVVGLGFGWMVNFWGETVIDSTTVQLTYSYFDSTVTIAEQDYITTLYDGDPYPYTIFGTGTFVDDTLGYRHISLNYELDQEGFECADWCATNGYLTTDLFVANITLDPNGKMVTKPRKPANFNKPY